MLVAGMAALLASAVAVPAIAQTEFPPWPLLYEGTVLLDGIPASGEVFARVGDWESDHVPVEDGAFRCADPCLIVGPPSFDYIGEPVTFHLIGEPGSSGEHVASLTYSFPRASEPSRTQVELLFGDIGAPGEPKEGVLLGLSGRVVGVAGLGLVLIVAVGASAGYRARRRARG
jgi:hypothetical protein